MEATTNAVSDVLIIGPKVLGEARSFFFKSFHQQALNQVTDTNHRLEQGNTSCNGKGVLSGLHHQVPRTAPGKLVRVVCRTQFSVEVDTRKSSPTFGQRVGVELSQGNHRQLWVPAGFLHGFVVFNESADFLYETTDAQVPTHEHCMNWNDPGIDIDWPAGSASKLSEKDCRGLAFSDADVFD